jgi:hypothetical protein
VNELEKLTRATETELRRFYVAECTARFEDARLFIRNVGVIEFEGRVFRSGITGQADVWGWFFIKPWPKPLEIECKNVRTKETDEQRAWAAYCISKNVPYLKLRARKGETPKQIVDRWSAETGIWLAGLQ